MKDRDQLRRMGDAQLLAGVAALVRRGNELTSELLAHLIEVEERMLFAERGFSSMFAYCVRGLGLSESAAFRRMGAAHACRRFPAAFAGVAQGRLHLSTLCSLARHLSEENAAELLALCSNKTRRKVDELIAARFPRPDERERVRRLPARRAARAGTGAETDRAEAPPEVQARVQADQKLVPEGGAQTHVSLEIGDGARKSGEALPAQAKLLPAVQAGEPFLTAGPRPLSAPGGSHGPRGSVMTDSGTQGATRDAAVRSAPAMPRRKSVEPLSAGRFGVHFTADAEFMALLERARALASHRLPAADLASVLKLALHDSIEAMEKRRFGVGRKPRAAKGQNATKRTAKASLTAFSPTEAPVPSLRSEALEPNLLPPGGSRALPEAGASSDSETRSRHIALAERRVVYARDEACCSFVAADGTRCRERAFLEVDHVAAWARGGPNEAGNLRLYCRAHNQLHARHQFGREYVSGAIARARAAAPASG